MRTGPALPLQGHVRVRAIQWQVWAVLGAAVLPNLVWIIADQTAWPWDQAFYAKYSVDLFLTLLHRPSAWLHAMLTALGRMAPGIAWVGQLFVPIGLLTGSIDSALLLSVVVAQAVALILVAGAIFQLSGGRRSGAVSAVLIVGAAPLCIAVSHHYLVEMMQMTAVAWFIFLMARAPSAGRLWIVSQLILATCFAMLAKVSSPLFCFAPGLVASYYLIRGGSTQPSTSRHGAIVGLAVAIPVAVLTVAWYRHNFQTVLAHVALASSGRVAELYGKAEPLLPSLGFWLSAVAVNLFSLPTALVSAGILCGALVSAARGSSVPAGFRSATLVATVQIAITLVIFSLASNRDVRYLLPLLPYFAVLLSWAVLQVNRTIVSGLVLGAFVLQGACAHLESFGIVAAREPSSAWLNPAMYDSTDRRVLDAIVQRTCLGTGAGIIHNALGVQLISLNAPGLSYAASKTLARHRTPPCEFDAIDYYDGKEADAWQRLLSNSAAHYIALEAGSYTIPPTVVDRTLNQLNEPILDRVRTSGLFQLEGGIAERAGVLIFTRVDRVDHLAYGRSLSDRGQHQEAVDELRKATALEPANVEAWANLALAQERRGDMVQAIVAGMEARRLQPAHFYVNLGLARAFSQQQRWADAIRSAQDAAQHAPGTTERVAALALAAQGSFEAGKPRDGCSLLRQLDALQPTAAVEADLVRRGCGR